MEQQHRPGLIDCPQASETFHHSLRPILSLSLSLSLSNILFPFPFHPISSHFIPSHSLLSYPILSCPTCPTCPILSCLVPLRFVSIRLVSSCPVLSASFLSGSSFTRTRTHAPTHACSPAGKPSLLSSVRQPVPLLRYEPTLFDASFPGITSLIIIHRVSLTASATRDLLDIYRPAPSSTRLPACPLTHLPTYPT